MKLYITYIIIVLAFIALALIPNKTSSEPPKIVEIPKTFDSEITRLAIKYNKPEPLAREVIRCEGLMYKQKGNNANIDDSGAVWSHDIGWWQINDYYHQNEALRRGYDIHDEWDNLEYGFILWSEQGLQPWSASRACWEHML